MKEITFKAENEFELFFIVEDYMNGFVQRNGKIDKMRKYYIQADVDDSVFEYWYAGGINNINKISQLINLLEGSDKLEVGDIVSIQFDTKKLGFERDLQNDYSAARFKIDHRLFEYSFLTSIDKLDFFQEYILIPIPLNS